MLATESRSDSIHSPYGNGRKQARTALGRHRRTGMTLVELLIAIALTGIILVIIFTALRTGADSWDAVESRTAVSHRMRLVHGLLRRQLAEVRPVSGRRRQAPALSGDDRRLSYRAPLTVHGAPGGFYRMQLSRRKQQLVLDWRQDVEHGGERGSVVLATGVESLSLDYYGARKRDRPPRWQPRWSEKQRLPQLVRLRLRVDGQAWPPLVARLQLAPR